MAHHDASRWWQGHHHPTGGCQRSWEATRLSEIVGGDLPSFLSFWSAGGGTWAVAGCRNDVVRLDYFSQRSGQHIQIGMLSSGCDVCECRVLLPEEVWIGERATCPSLGSPDGVTPDSEACHVSLGGGVPTDNS